MVVYIYLLIQNTSTSSEDIPPLPYLVSKVLTLKNSICSSVNVKSEQIERGNHGLPVYFKSYAYV